MSERLTYSFGPLERRGIAGGFDASQLAALACGALLAIVALDRYPTVGGAMLAGVICASAGALAFMPVGGRTAQEWLPLVVRFAAAKVFGRDQIGRAHV